MRRTEQGLLLGGIALVSTGVLGSIWGQAEANLALAGNSRASVILGTILLCYVGLVRRLARRQAAEDEAYRFGFDMGEAAGYRKGRQVSRPVVVSLTDHKASKAAAFSRAPGAADRG